MSKSTNQMPEDLKLYSLQELATLILKDQKIHSGLYEMSLEIQVAAGAVGPDAESILPGAVFGVKSVGLRKVDKANPLTVDASIANPPAKTRKKATTTSQ